jgi:hypothetical protein
MLAVALYPDAECCEHMILRVCAAFRCSTSLKTCGTFGCATRDAEKLR